MDNIKWPDQIQQEQEIQEETAKLVFSPEFIPYFVDIKKEFQLSHLTTLVYGFIRYYLKRKGSKFYFTNQQLMEVLDTKSETYVTDCLTELKKKELITVKYIIKGGGGKVRFVDWVYGRTLEKPNSDFGKNRTRDEATTSEKTEDNKNINKNNIKGKIFKNENIKVGGISPTWEDIKKARKEMHDKKQPFMSKQYYEKPQTMYIKKGGIANGKGII